MRNGQTLFDRLHEVLTDFGIDRKAGPQNRADRRRLQRAMNGHTPGPFHRNLTAARRYCETEITLPGRKLTCGAQLPSYRAECEWHHEWERQLEGAQL